MYRSIVRLTYCSPHQATIHTQSRSVDPVDVISDTLEAGVFTVIGCLVFRIDFCSKGGLNLEPRLNLPAFPGLLYRSGTSFPFDIGLILLTVFACSICLTALCILCITLDKQYYYYSSISNDHLP